MTSIYVKKDGVLSKEEIREFLKESLKRGRFNALFEAENWELKVFVDQLMGAMFGSIDFDLEDGTAIDIFVYNDTIESKLQGDPLMAPMIQLFDSSTQDFITKQQIKDGFTKICRENFEVLQKKIDEINKYNEEVLEKTGGKFAREYIERLFFSYEERQL